MNSPSSSDLQEFLPSFIKMTNYLIENSTMKERTLPTVLINISYNPPTFNNCAVEVRDSKYGRGVFAKRDIKKGEVPTLFPVHQYTSPPDHFGKYYGMNYNKKPIQYDPFYCLIHNDSKAFYTGDRDMMDNFFLGHLINDFYPFVEEFQDKEKNIGETMMKYYMYGITHRNCDFIMTRSPWVLIQVLKDIKEGEELLIGYSPSYWLSITDDEMEKEILKYIDSIAITNIEKAEFMCKKLNEYNTNR